MLPLEQAAQKAYDTVWGLNTPGSERGRLLCKLADLMEENAEELAALESLNNGKAYNIAKSVDVANAAACFRYYGGWADKNHGKTIEGNVPFRFATTGCLMPTITPCSVNETKLAYTRVEP